MDSIQRIKQLREQQVNKASQAKQFGEQQLSVMDLQKTVLEAAKGVVDYMDGNTSKVVVTNQLESIGTPDALKVAEAIEEMHSTLKTHENTDMSETVGVLKQILNEAKDLPKSIPKPEKQKFKDYSQEFKLLTDAVKAANESVKAQKIQVEAPVVNVDAPQVTVDAPDLKPFEKNIVKAFDKSVKGILFPKYKTDNSKVEKLLEKHTKLLKDIRDEAGKGGGGGGLTLGELAKVSVVESTDNPGVFGLVVLNPDGSTLSAGGGSSPSSTYGSGVYGTAVYA